MTTLDSHYYSELVDHEAFAGALPRVIFKYRDPNDDFHMRLLKASEIYFPSPRRFNDPFDCRIGFRYDLVKTGELRDHIKKLLRETDPNLSRIEMEKRITHAITRRTWDRTDHEQAAFETVCDNVGVFCAGSHPDSLLMWSHYADSHKGICVGLDSALLGDMLLEEFNRTNRIVFARKVEYGNYPVICAIKTSIEDKYFQSVYHKSAEWRYEDEVRFTVLEQTDVALSIPATAFRCVIFGASMPRKAREEVLSVCQSRFPELEFYQASRKKNEFGLCFEPVE